MRNGSRVPPKATQLVSRSALSSNVLYCSSAGDEGERGRSPEIPNPRNYIEGLWLEGRWLPVWPEVLGGSEVSRTCPRATQPPAPPSTSAPGALEPISACLDLSSDFYSWTSEHVAFTGQNCEPSLPSVRSGLITSQTVLGFQH